MFWHDLESSDVHSAAYVDEGNILYIKFNDGSCYAYPRVSKELFTGILAAKSAGKFHHKYIYRLPCVKVFSYKDGFYIKPPKSLINGLKNNR